MKKGIGLCIALLLTFTVIAQGSIDGFYRGKGNATFVLGGGYKKGNAYFAGNDKLDIGREEFYVSLFGSYGITNIFDVQVSVPYTEIGPNKAFQDIRFFAKYRFYEQQKNSASFQLSTALGFSTPLSNYTIGGLNDIGQQATSLEPIIMGHYQLDTGWFVTLQTGYAFKFDEVPDALPTTLKLGRALQTWYFDGYYESQYSFGGIDYRGTPRPQNFKEFAVDYHKIGGTIFKPLFKNFGIYGSVSYVFAGRNIFQGPGYGLGLVYDLKKNNAE
ncbi:transporter [Altibacter sp.]|uniref:transporter n=1 Tax=Altibacter sp. TaxID=2024823 RepID=UPI000C908387|nr:transporter [Altibacter sp.]MAP55450.1 hypothetical protein [Altibacter sp.]